MKYISYRHIGFKKLTKKTIFQVASHLKSPHIHYIQFYMLIEDFGRYTKHSEFCIFT